MRLFTIQAPIVAAVAGNWPPMPAGAGIGPAARRKVVETPMDIANAKSETTGRMSSRTRLLVIDDDRKLCRLIKGYLEPMGYTVDAAHTGPDGLAKANAEKYHAVILDVMLPELDGFEVLKQLRRTSNVPVLMLTARGEESDRIVGLELGADDYLPKTFSTRELLARLRAVTRRSTETAKPEGPEPDIVAGRLRINPSARVALLDDQPLALTPVEFDLLASLARALGRVKSREQLLEEIADRNYDVFDRSIDVHISSLRKKLGDDPKSPRFIKTVRSAGYMLKRPGDPDT
jgi:DNA-binding response OmpR family regulator